VIVGLEACGRRAAEAWLLAAPIGRWIIGTVRLIRHGSNNDFLFIMFGEDRAMSLFPVEGIEITTYLIILAQKPAEAV
jgi:hypothetical protein